MGYKIVYGKPQHKKGSFPRFPFLIFLFFLFFAVIVRFFRPEMAQDFGRLLITDELSREAEAVATMVQQWTQWDDLSDAVEVFCQELLGGT